MTKITNKIIEDYVMLYPRIECVKIEESEELINPLKWAYLDCEYGNEIEYIQLRSIESITDEEYIEVAKIHGAPREDIYKVEGGKSIIKNEFFPNGFSDAPMSMVIETIDYLRSIGIATNFRGITLDKLVESSKLKLI